MEILIIGTGYVGLVTGTCFAQMGHKVCCLDTDASKIEMLQKGEIPFFEPLLKELVLKNIAEKRLSFTTSYKEGVIRCKVLFICVPTPSKKDGSCDLSFIENAALLIAENLNEYKLIVIKSTVPVGCAKFVKNIVEKTLKKRNKKINFDIVSNPEFLKEGSAVADCMKPDRIIIGVDSKKSEKIMKDIYSPFMVDHDRVLIMDILSSEMTKYAANSMLATRISFMNEMAAICSRVGANINEVRKGIGSDQRIGYSFLYAGIGYGGSCFPKDIKALTHTAKENGYTAELLKAVDAINVRQKRLLAEKIIAYFASKGGIKNKIIAIWGLSFKPETDDMREAPSLEIIDMLQKEGAKLKLFDPVAMPKTKKILKSNKALFYCNSEFEAAKDSHAIALLTEWKQFRLIDFSIILSTMKGRGFFDGRNQYKPQEMKQKGFDYICIGAPDQLTRSLHIE